MPSDSRSLWKHRKATAPGGIGAGYPQPQYLLARSRSCSLCTLTFASGSIIATAFSQIIYVGKAFLSGFRAHSSISASALSVTHRAYTSNFFTPPYPFRTSLLYVVYHMTLTILRSNHGAQEKEAGVGCAVFKSEQRTSLQDEMWNVFYERDPGTG